MLQQQFPIIDLLQTTEGFDCFKEDLLVYLVQRFGSLALAKRIVEETRHQLGDDSILAMVGDPAVYLMGFALSIGLKMTGIKNPGGKP